MVRTKWFRIAMFLVCCTPLFLLAAVFVNYETIPRSDTPLTHFDTLIVLGTPAKADGTPSPEQRERVLEGVREWKAGVAPYIIMTGGSAHNKWTEGQVMVDYAASQGVPRDALIVEGQAHDTIQNIWYSKIIMDGHGWKSAEVISSPYHLPRTGLILEHYQFAWETHKAHMPPEYSWKDDATRYIREALGCWDLRWHGYPHNKYLPGT